MRIEQSETGLHKQQSHYGSYQRERYSTDPDQCPASEDDLPFRDEEDPRQGRQETCRRLAERGGVEPVRGTDPWRSS